MLLHLTPLVERQRPRFFEKAGRQTDLADVVNETTEMSELLVPSDKPKRPAMSRP